MGLTELCENALQVKKPEGLVENNSLAFVVQSLQTVITTSSPKDNPHK